jgi:hypothetical protein
MRWTSRLRRVTQSEVSVSSINKRTQAGEFPSVGLAVRDGTVETSAAHGVHFAPISNKAVLHIHAESCVHVESFDNSTHRRVDDTPPRVVAGGNDFGRQTPPSPSRGTI